MAISSPKADDERDMMYVDRKKERKRKRKRTIKGELGRVVMKRRRTETSRESQIRTVQKLTRSM